MSNISSNAFIHPNAKIGQHVTIEAFAYIDDNTEIGDETYIMSGAQIRSGARLGKKCTVFPGAVVSGVPQDLKFQGEDTLAIIGEGTTIRECVTISRGTKAKGQTIIGKHCLLMACSHVAHDCILKDHIILGNSTLLAGEVEVDDYAILSGGTLVHQFTRVGKHVMIQGGTRLGKDIPPYVIAGREPVTYAGINLVGLRRRGFSNEQINQIQEIYRMIYSSGHNFSDAIAKLEQDFEHTAEMELIVDFIKNSPRGIVRGYL